MPRRNRQIRYTRTGMRHIGDLLPSVLAQYAKPQSEGKADDQGRKMPRRKPVQQVFSFAR